MAAHPSEPKGAAKKPAKKPGSGKTLASGAKATGKTFGTTPAPQGSGLRKRKRKLPPKSPIVEVTLTEGVGHLDIVVVRAPAGAAGQHFRQQVQAFVGERRDSRVGRRVLRGLSETQAQLAKEALASQGAITKMEAAKAVFKRPGFAETLPSSLTAFHIAEILSEPQLDVEAWLTGRRTPDEIQRGRISALVESARAFGESWDADLFPGWMLTPNAHLSGARPAEVLAAKGAAPLIAAIDAAAWGAYA